MRGYFFIHSSRSLANAEALTLPRGAIVGIARITGCRELRDTWAWRLADARRLRVPIPCKGAVGFFRLPPAVVRRIPRSILSRVAMAPISRPNSGTR